MQTNRAPSLQTLISIGSQDVHIWICKPEDIDDGDLLAQYEQLLSTSEIAKKGRFYHQHDGHNYLVAHALVRCMLSRYVDCPPAQWHFEVNRYGRPEIAAGTCQLPLRFNLTHTKGMVAVAITLSHDIGLDVEHLSRPSAVQGIAQQFFSPTEVSHINEQPPSLRRQLFFRYWTLKEAYIKARGMGVSLPLDHFWFELDGPNGIEVVFDPRLEDDPANWAFSLFHPSPIHTMALCTNTKRTGHLDLQIRRTVPLLNGDSPVALHQLTTRPAT